MVLYIFTIWIIQLKSEAMLKILIVDDEKIIRKAMGQMFKKYGECKFADCGQTAIDGFKAGLEKGEAFDLVVLDIALEDKSGLEVLKAIRSIEGASALKKADRSKIIMATGNQKLKMVKACIDAGCDNYILKPLKSADVAQALEKMGIPALETPAPDGSDSPDPA